MERKGDLMQRRIPLGYKIQNGKAEIMPPDARIVKAVFQAYLKGVSTNSIAKELTNQKVPNANHKFSWNHGSVGKILENQKYLGDDFYPQLIDNETFRRAQRMRREKAEYLGRLDKSDGSKKSVFEGKLYCGHCGEPYHRYREHCGKAEETAWWQCRHSVKEKRLCSHNCLLTDEQIERAFLAITNQLIEVPSILEPRRLQKVKAPASSAASDRVALEIQRAFETGEYTAKEIKRLAFLRASIQYQAATIDDSAFQTEKLRGILAGVGMQSHFSAELFSKSIQKIVVYEDGSLFFHLINGVMLEKAVGSNKACKREKMREIGEKEK